MISQILMITIAYILGLVSVLRIDFGTAALFSLCLVFVCTVMGIFKRRMRSRITVAAAMFAGVMLMSAAWYANCPELSGVCGRYAELEGVVTDCIGKYDENYSYEFAVDRLCYRENESIISAVIRVTSDKKFDVGNRLALRGFLREISEPDNRTEFDFRTYYKAKGIIYRLHAEEAQLIKEKELMLSPSYLGSYIKSRIAFAIDRYYSGDYAAMMKAVLLGIKSEFSENFKDTLLRTSANRFLRPSYMHIFLIISMCEFVFAFAKRGKRQVLLAVMLFVYAMLNSGFHVFIKAALLLVLTKLYSRIRGFSHYPDLLSVVILILLTANPLFITSSWFVMSIGAGIVIYNFYRPLSEAMQKKLPNASKSLISAISVWIVGTVGMMPFGAYFFNGSSMYSIIFSLFYMPLSLALLIISPFAILLYETVGNAYIIGLFCDGILKLMKALPEIVEMLPGYYINLGKPDALAIAIMLCLAFVLKLLISERTEEKKFKAAALICLTLFSANITQQFKDRGNMYVYFVNVGQGDGAVIEVSGKNLILIDGGGKSGESNYNAGKEKFLPYLAANGFFRIDLAIVSHYHSDHSDGIVAAIENLRVNTVMMPDVMPENEIRKQIEDAANANGTRILYVGTGDRLDFTSGLSIEVLSPGRYDYFGDENDTSLALKVCCNNTSMFFGGDITEEKERDILGKTGMVDILKASHHGSKTSSCEEFVTETVPLCVVFSAGENNMFGHPNENVLNRFANVGSEIFRTDKQGDIIMKCDKHGKMSVSIFKEDWQWQ